MNCPACALTNRPYSLLCARCGRQIQEPESAEQKKREWDGLPKEIRAEYEQDYDKALVNYDEHRRWLRKHRIVHALIGGILVSFFMNSALGFPAVTPIFIDFLIGAGAGLLLNLKKGGSYRGMAIFAAASCVSVLLLMPFIDAKGYWQGWWLFSALGLMVTAGGGYYMGLKLDMEHHDHSVAR